MCIIIGGLKKNLKVDEQLRGMANNRDGFAICRIIKGQAPKVTRTLDIMELMKEWEAAGPDEYVVTHSRIPSHGTLHANLADVHGWTREGVTFFHNGTLTNIIDLMEKSDKRTDSLFFFEEIFIPLWKSQGRNFTKLLDRVCSVCCGSSRFCIVLPDGSVHYYGKFVEDHDCFFSNTSYKHITSACMSEYYIKSSDPITTHIPLEVRKHFGLAEPEKPAPAKSTSKSSSSDVDRYVEWHREQRLKKGEKEVFPLSVAGDDEEEVLGGDDIDVDIVGAVGLETVARVFLERLAIINVQDLVAKEAVASKPATKTGIVEGLTKLNDWDLTTSDSFIMDNFEELTSPTFEPAAIGNLLRRYAERLEEDLAEGGLFEDLMLAQYTNENIAKAFKAAIQAIIECNRAEAHILNLWFAWGRNSSTINGFAYSFSMQVNAYPSGFSYPSMTTRTINQIWIPRDVELQSTIALLRSLNLILRLAQLPPEDTANKEESK